LIVLNHKKSGAATYGLMRLSADVHTGATKIIQDMLRLLK